MADEKPRKRSVHCDRTADETPLIQLEYGVTTFWICPQHLPVLIHDPGQLIGKLPGAERFKPAETHD